MTLDAQIEAILFWKAEPITLKKLTDILSVDLPAITEAIVLLRTKLEGRGLTIIEANEEITIGTAPAASALIEKLTKEELMKDLGKAGLETLAIIIYQGPLSRSEVDYVRGVNSTFIIRNLLVRGLIEKVDNPNDQRSFLYKPSLELLAHMGLSKLEDMPEYAEVRTKIEEFKKVKDETR